MAPLFDSVVVDLEKLEYYCLSDAHPRGRHKARVFRSRLGMTGKDAEILRDALLAAVRNAPGELRPTLGDQYGSRYVLDFSMTTQAGAAIIRSLWIVPANQNVLRLVSCYVM